MDVQDGFIVGIFNYCDSWCRACPFTSRCRVFVNIAKAEAASDPHLQAVVDATPLPQDVPLPPSPWVQALIEDANEAASDVMAGAKFTRQRVKLVPEHQSIRRRAHSYCDRVYTWLRARDFHSFDDPSDPRAVVTWFHTLIPSKIVRALEGIASDVPQERDWPADHDGSAKVALLGIERSHAALLQMVDAGLASHPEVDPLVADLTWLGTELERVFPNARAFVRAAFDEPDEVARLYAIEGRR
jgi:hypothetical protein